MCWRCEAGTRQAPAPQPAAVTLPWGRDNAARGRPRSEAMRAPGETTVPPNETIRAWRQKIAAPEPARRRVEGEQMSEERICEVCGKPVDGRAGVALCKVHGVRFSSRCSYLRGVGKPAPTLDAWVADQRRDEWPAPKDKPGRGKAAPRAARHAERGGSIQPARPVGSRAATAERLADHYLEDTDWAKMPAELKWKIVELVMEAADGASAA